ncbi:MAG TPA: hypothetical protein VI700_01155 [Thermoanaerobaculaceae bacterium]|nr:hypothetical protein [Thermoanaerobaculaceae bacterium]
MSEDDRKLQLVEPEESIEEWEARGGHILRPRPHAPVSPEEQARLEAEGLLELQEAARSLRISLLGLLAKHVLPFRPKTSSSSTPPTPAHPSPQK